LADRVLELVQRLAQIVARSSLRLLGPEQPGKQGASVRMLCFHGEVAQQSLRLGGEMGYRPAVEQDNGPAEQRERQAPHA